MDMQIEKVEENNDKHILDNIKDMIIKTEEDLTI